MCPVTKTGVRISNHIENPEIEGSVIEAEMYICMHDLISSQKKVGKLDYLDFESPVYKSMPFDTSKSGYPETGVLLYYFPYLTDSLNHCEINKYLMPTNYPTLNTVYNQ